MASDILLPPVVLFFEGTGTREVFQKIVSGLQRGGRRVKVFSHAQLRLGRDPQGPGSQEVASPNQVAKASTSEP